MLQPSKIIFLYFLLVNYSYLFGQNAEDIPNLIENICLLKEINTLKKYQKILGKETIVIYHNTLLKNLGIQSYKSDNIYLMDEGGVYYYDVQYILQFEDILIKDNKASLKFFTSSRYSGEHSKNMQYIKCAISFVKKKGKWTLKKKKIESEKCCRWRLN